MQIGIYVFATTPFTIYRLSENGIPGRVVMNVQVAAEFIQEVGRRAFGLSSLEFVSVLPGEFVVCNDPTRKIAFADYDFKKCRVSPFNIDEICTRYGLYPH